MHCKQETHWGDTDGWTAIDTDAYTHHITDTVRRASTSRPRLRPISWANSTVAANAALRRTQGGRVSSRGRCSQSRSANCRTLTMDLAGQGRAAYRALRAKFHKVQEAIRRPIGTCATICGRWVDAGRRKLHGAAGAKGRAFGASGAGRARAKAYLKSIDISGRQWIAILGAPWLRTCERHDWASPGELQVLGDEGSGGWSGHARGR